MKKLISQSTFHLKGSGWYVTDYASKGSKDAGKKETSTKDKETTTKETKSSDDKTKKTTSSTKKEKKAKDWRGRVVWTFASENSPDVTTGDF